MTELTTKERNALPDDAFALPGRRYPIYDTAHARNALARAAEMYKKGKLTKEEYDMVVTRVNAVLKRHIQSANLSAVIVKGNPKFITSPEAKKYYADIDAYLHELGVSDVSYDAGAPHTCPKKADLYIGHSRGADRDQCVTDGKTPFVKLGVPSGVIDPKDLAWQKARDPKSDEAPPKEHFMLTVAQKKAIRDAVDRAHRNKVMGG